LSIAGSQTGAASYSNLDGSGSYSYGQGLTYGKDGSTTFSQSGSESSTSMDGISTSKATSVTNGKAGTTIQSIETSGNAKAAAQSVNGEAATGTAAGSLVGYVGNSVFGESFATGFTAGQVTSVSAETLTGVIDYT